MWRKIAAPLLRAAAVCGLCAALVVGCMWLEKPHTLHETEFIFVGTQNEADCCIMLSGGKCVLVDTGEAVDAEHIMEVLTEKQVERIDSMILTHPDQDHVGGAGTLLDHVAVNQIVTPYFSGEKAVYQELMNKAERMHIPVMTLPRDRQFVYGDLRLRVFPPEKFYYEKSNDYSLATLVEHGDVTLFLTGDAEKERLKELLKLPLPEKIQLYKVAHHGRDSAKGVELIERLAPAYAIVTAQEPEREIEVALDRIGTVVCRTVGQDAVFISDGVSLEPKTEL